MIYSPLIQAFTFAALWSASAAQEVMCFVFIEFVCLKDRLCSYHEQKDGHQEKSVTRHLQKPQCGVRGKKKRHPRNTVSQMSDRKVKNTTVLSADEETETKPR